MRFIREEEESTSSSSSSFRRRRNSRLNRGDSRKQQQQQHRRRHKSSPLIKRLGSDDASASRRSRKKVVLDIVVVSPDRGTHQTFFWMTLCTDFSFPGEKVGQKKNQKRLRELQRERVGKAKRREWCDKIETDDDNAVLKVCISLSFFFCLFVSFFLHSSVCAYGTRRTYGNRRIYSKLPGHPFSCAYFKHSK